MKILIANLLTQDQLARLGEVFWTDMTALVSQRDQCWRIANDCLERWPENYPSWMDHVRAVQAAIDGWEGAQL